MAAVPPSMKRRLRRYGLHGLTGLLMIALGIVLVAEPLNPGPIDDEEYSNQYSYRIRPGNENLVLRLLDLDPDEPGPVPGVGYWAENIVILDDRVRVEYWSDDGRKKHLVVYHPNELCKDCKWSRYVGVVAEAEDEDSSLLQGWLLEHLGPEFTAIWQEQAPNDELLGGETESGELIEPPRWLGRHPAEVWLLINQVLWLFFAVLGIWSLIEWGRRARGVLRATVGAVGLIGGAFALRLFTATWGPGDLFLNTSEVFWRLPATFYGNAPDALLFMLFKLAPERTETLVAVTLVLGSLSTGLAWLLARELDRDHRVFPWIVAILVAVQPVLVRFSGEANRQMYVLFFGAAALWSWLRWERTGRWLDAALAAVAATLCAHSRPEAFPLLLLLPLWTLIKPGKGRHRGASWLVFVGILGAYATYYRTTFQFSTMESVYLGNLFTMDLFFLGPEVNLWMDPSFTPVALIVLLPLGLVSGLVRRRWWVLWAGCSLLGLAFIASSMPTGLNGARQLASARYQTLAVLFASLLAAEGVLAVVLAGARCPRAWAGKAAWVLVVASILGTLIVPLRGVTKPTTLDHEYRLMKEWILALPLRTEVYQPYNYRFNDLGLRDVVHLGRNLGRGDVNWLNWPDEWRPSEKPQVFWQQASCGIAARSSEIFFDIDSSTPALAKICDEVTVVLAEHRLLSAEIPLRPFLNAARDLGVVEVGMYLIPPGIPMPPEWFPEGEVPKMGAPR